MTTIELSFFDEGAEEGLPLVLLHDAGFDGELWAPQIEHLVAQGVRLLVPDLRGHGQSPKTGAQTLDDFVQDVIRLVDSVGVGRFVLCGTGAGATIALELARTQASRLGGLALVAPMVAPPPTGTFDLLRSQGPAQALSERWLSDSTRQKQPQRIEDLRQTLLRADVPATERLLRICGHPVDVARTLVALNVPIFLAAGAEDRWTPLATMTSMKRVLPKSDLRVISGAAHLPAWEAPEPFNHVFEDWLRVFQAEGETKNV